MGEVGYSPCRSSGAHVMLCCTPSAYFVLIGEIPKLRNSQSNRLQQRLIIQDVQSSLLVWAPVAQETKVGPYTWYCCNVNKSATIHAMVV